MNERSNDDRLISELYREISEEQTPASLDRKIIRQAASGRSSSKPGLFTLRPLAWVATIGLTLAIVLELQQTQQGISLTPMQPVDSPVIELERQRPEPKAEADIDAAEAEKRTSIQQDLQLLERSEAPAAVSLESAAENLSVAPMENFADSQAGAPTESIAESHAVVPAESTAESKMSVELEQIMEDLQRDQSRERADAFSDNRRALGITADFPASSSLAPEAATARYCDEATIAAAQSWYECVLRLEKEGLQTQADFELSLLKTEYPDFKTR